MIPFARFRSDATRSGDEEFWYRSMERSLPLPRGVSHTFRVLDLFLAADTAATAAPLPRRYRTAYVEPHLKCRR